MKYKLKQVKFTKAGKCKGKIKIRGKSRRRICYAMVQA